MLAVSKIFQFFIQPEKHFLIMARGAQSMVPRYRRNSEACLDLRIFFILASLDLGRKEKFSASVPEVSF
jgi:hypothetical protein